jgi:hypothetical protein
VALKLARRFNMEKGAIKDMMFGGVLELSRNSRYYYHSGVGASYSHWTEQGKEALLEYMETMTYKMKVAEEAELEKRAQKQTLDILKGDSKK